MRAGRPMLSSVAVGVNGKGGSGFFGLARELGRLDQNEDETVFWKDELLAAYSAWRRPLPTSELRSSVEASFFRASRAAPVGGDCPPVWPTVESDRLHLRFGARVVDEADHSAGGAEGFAGVQAGRDRPNRPRERCRTSQARLAFQRALDVGRLLEFMARERAALRGSLEHGLSDVAGPACRASDAGHGDPDDGVQPRPFVHERHGHECRSQEREGGQYWDPVCRTAFTFLAGYNLVSSLGSGTQFCR